MPEDVTPERLAELRAMPYAEYLLTREWRRRRDRMIAKADWRCQVASCTSSRELQVHHRTYERLGNELDDDLQVLCGKCHRQTHVEQFEHSELGIYLKLARQARREDLGCTIADLSERTKQLCAQNHVPYDRSVIHRAIGLLTGARIVPITPEALANEHSIEARAITQQEAFEISQRLEEHFGVVLGDVIKTLPDGILPHEDSVLEQARQARAELRSRQQRDESNRSWSDRLDAIFSREDQEDVRQRVREQAEIRQQLREWGIRE